MSDLDESKKLMRILESLLGESGVNVLGKCLINNQLAPAIYLRFPTEGIVRKMKPNSGIECVIEPISDTISHPQQRGVNFTDFYTVTLDQHNPIATLDTALKVIYAHPVLRPLDAPILRPRMESPNQKGETPARAVLFIPVFTYQPNLF